MAATTTTTGIEQGPSTNGHRTKVAIIDPREAKTFEEFWPYYVSQHLESGTRALHVLGTTIATLWVALSVLKRRPLRILAAPLIGYGFAWAGHFGIEGNKPATIGNPAWSLQADFRLVARTFSGRIGADVAAVRAALAAQAEG